MADNNRLVKWWNRTPWRHKEIAVPVSNPTPQPDASGTQQSRGDRELDFDPPVRRFTVLDEFGQAEAWAAHLDVEDRAFVCEWVDNTAYSADHAISAPTLTALIAQVGSCLPAEVREGLARDAAVAGLESDSASIPVRASVAGWWASPASAAVRIAQVGTPAVPRPQTATSARSEGLGL